LEDRKTLYTKEVSVKISFAVSDDGNGGFKLVVGLVTVGPSLDVNNKLTETITVKFTL
jgi:hypothetical protein